MGFDFTVAIAPSDNIEQELQYIKAALLYADKITLISPLAYLYSQLSSQSNHLSEKDVVRMIEYALPLCRKQEPVLYQNGLSAIGQLKSLLYSPKYRSVKYVDRIKIRKELLDYAAKIDSVLLEILGEEDTKELQILLKSKKLVLQPFEHDLTDLLGITREYFGMLGKSIKSSFPLFDETSSKLMSAAVSARIVQLNDMDKRKITHAGLSEKMIRQLPSFERASVDEILDINKELNGPLTRFRAKMLTYSDNIQSLPWDDHFEEECSLLYHKEIAPELQEIEELTHENSFVKNLGREIISDGSFLKTAGGLVVGIAAAGIIPSFTQSISSDVTILATGGACATTKIAAAYNDYRKNKKEIEKKDLYFYYKAGKILEKAVK